MNSFPLLISAIYVSVVRPESRASEQHFCPDGWASGLTKILVPESFSGWRIPERDVEVSN